MAVVLETSDQSARIGFQPGRELGGAVSKTRETGLISLDGVRWAKAAAGPTRFKTPTAVTQVLAPATRSMSIRCWTRTATRLRDSTGSVRYRKFPARWLRWIRGPAAWWPWSAASRSTRASSTARRKLIVSRVRPSSRSSIRPRWITATRRQLSSWTRRSKSIRGRAPVSGVRKTTPLESITDRPRCGTR